MTCRRGCRGLSRSRSPTDHSSHPAVVSVHNPGVSSRITHPTVFNRLRRSSVLRAVLLIATLLASQNSFACALEATFASTEIASAATTIDVQLVAPETLDEGCGDLCLDCTHCGSCCGQMSNPRAVDIAGCAASDSKITLTTVAPHRWASPTPLRPPIDTL
jgi:hypothetical protein